MAVSTEKTNFAFMARRGNPVKKKRDVWFVDSGSASHICNDKSKFVDYKEFEKPGKVILGDGRRMDVLGKGHVYLKSYTANGPVQIKLLNVSYAPGATENLLSVGRATRNGAKFRFGRFGFRMMKSGYLLAEGVRRGDLFELKGSTVHPEELNSKKLNTSFGFRGCVGK